MKRLRSIPAPFMAALLFGLAFALFSPTLRYGLVDLDDLSYVSSNPLVMEGFSTANVRAVFTSFRQGMYAPLLWISYLLDATFLNASPVAPGGFHFTNVLLHALNAVLLFLLLRALCKQPWRAFFFAAVWALHPLRVESVAWVTERKDVLSGLFGLLCLAAYLRAHSHGHTAASSRGLPFHWAALLFLALGLLVKASLVPLPGVLLVLDVWPLRRVQPTLQSIRQAAPRLLTEKIPFIALAALASFGASHAHRALHALTSIPLSTRLLGAPMHYVIYLAKSAWPRHLSPLYPDLVPTIAASGLALLLLMVLTAWAWFARHRQPERLAGWLIFLGVLLPAIGLVRFGIQSIADRFTYFPAIGLSIALLRVWPSRCAAGAARRAFRAGAALGLLLLLAGGTLRLLPAWRSPESLPAHVLSVDPDNKSALEMRSFQWIRAAGDFAKANAGFDRVLRSGAFNHNVLCGKARCATALQGPAAGLAILLQAPVTDNPFATHAIQWDMARYALMLGQYDEAISHAQRAIQTLPPFETVPAYLHLLILTAAFEQGDLPQALAHARHFPSFAERTSLELADLLPYYLHQWIEFHRADAYAFFRRLVQAHPDDLGLLNNIAWGLATANWSPAPPAEVLALAHRFNAAFEPANPGALDTLAAAQANAGDFAGAIQTLQQALGLLAGVADANRIPFRDRLHGRLELYRQGKPYREDAFDRLMAAQYGKGLPVSAKKAGP